MGKKAKTILFLLNFPTRLFALLPHLWNDEIILWKNFLYKHLRIGIERYIGLAKD